MFGLTEKSATPGASRGRSKGVVLVRSPRRISWLAGWSTPAPADERRAAEPRPPRSAGPGAPADLRNSPEQS